MSVVISDCPAQTDGLSVGTGCQTEARGKKQTELLAPQSRGLSGVSSRAPEQGVDANTFTWIYHSLLCLTVDYCGWVELTDILYIVCKGKAR